MRAYLLVTSVLVTTSVGELELVNQLSKLTSHIVRGKRSIAANYDDSHCLANFEQREKTIIRTKVSQFNYHILKVAHVSIFKKALN